MRFNSIPSLFIITFLFNHLCIAQGPQAPEATSFEPVDATDMVNLVTGDMSYVLPLLSIPSPEGGFPIALSYHAGIAMDQEASWVGLGWSLNPGAVNRSVKGNPDDWSRATRSSFFYDVGGTEDYYSFSIGGLLPNGISVGMSKAWGGYRAWGGSIGYAGQNFIFGSEGFGGSVAIPGTGLGFSMLPGQEGMNISTSISVGVSQQLSKDVAGDASLTGVVSFNTRSKNISMSGRASSKLNGIGVSFDVFSISSSGTNSYDSSISSGSVDAGDYDVVISNRGFNLNVGFFYTSYRHTKVAYSLFKRLEFVTSGIFQPYASTLEDSHGRIIDGRTMDVKAFFIDDSDMANHKAWRQNHSFISGKALPGFFDQILMPNYDSYSVSSQGLSGIITPVALNEMNLYDKSDTSSYFRPEISTSHAAVVSYMGVHAPTFSHNLQNNFHFIGVNSSFSRVGKGNWGNVNLGDSRNITDSKNIINASTAADNKYQSPLTADGHRKTSLGRLRRGRVIETFTNEEIINGATSGWFIESKAIGFDRTFPFRNKVFGNLKDGIGAYRITDTDGKVYHYSQPVYHHEKIYKNFQDDLNINLEDAKFYQAKDTYSYATHWLLTAITGPDYVDINNNGQLDEDDYGYWVEFEYGMWSGGSGYRTPKAGYQETQNITSTSPLRKSYSLGIKEVYYLDRIKTRTHSALFIKSVRNDNLSHQIEWFTSKRAMGNANLTQWGKMFKAQASKQFTLAGTFFRESNLGNWPVYDLVTFPENGSAVDNGKPFDITYLDVPSNKSLKLDQIIIIKNQDAIFDKSKISQLNNQNTWGQTYHNVGYELPNNVPNYPSSFLYRNTPYTVNGVWEPSLPNIFYGNLNDRILDVYDLEGTEIKNKALQTINFNYDYSLGSNLPNSQTGRHLALKEITFLGKNQVQTMPPYNFSYARPWTPYSNDDMDAWGYHDTYPESWSLNQIQTPLGSKIEIEYEEDSYNSEAAFRDFDTSGFVNFDYNSKDAVKRGGILSYQYDNGELIIDFDPIRVNYNLNSVFAVNQKLMINFSFGYIREFPSFSEERYGGGSILFKITEIDELNKKMTFQVQDTPRGPRISDLTDFNPNVQCTGSGLPVWPNRCYSSLKFNYNSGVFTAENPNGKQGGGLRVKKITTSTETSSVSTLYSYMDPTTNAVSGITSFEPSDEEGKVVPYIELLPAPNVYYKYVTVTADSDQISTTYKFDVLEPFNFTSHETFDNLNSSGDGTIYQLGDHFKVKVKQFPDGYHTNQYRNQLNTYIKTEIHDKTSRLGNLLTKTTTNQLGDILAINEYNFQDFNEEEDHEYGIIEESFNHYKLNMWQDLNGNPNDTSVDLLYFPSASSTNYIRYPSKLLNASESKGNYSFNTIFGSHDFLTGNTIETINYDAKGHSIITEKIPAYKLYWSMGSKVDNRNNKNMLTQNAMSKTYIERNGNWDLIGADITTWNNNWHYFNADGSYSNPTNTDHKIWRKHKTYFWDGEKDEEGTFLDYDGDYDNFNWGLGSYTTNSAGIREHQVSQPSNSDWKLSSEVTTYNHFSMPLEVRDINNNFVSTKTDAYHEKVFSTSNAAYTEQFYSGVEEGENDWVGGQVRIWNPKLGFAHTGEYAEAVDPGGKAFRCYPIPRLKAGQNNKKFKLSVWADTGSAGNALVFVDGNGYEFNGEKTVAGGWTQLNHYFELEQQTEIYVGSGSGRVNFDDFRVHPMSSSMTSYVYNEWDELSFILGANNMGTQYIYDEAGRLVEVWMEVADTPTSEGGFRKVKEMIYQYKSDVTLPTPPVVRNPITFSELDGTIRACVPGLLTPIGSPPANEEYRWAQSFSRSDLQFGPWTTENCFDLILDDCQTTYVKVAIRYSDGRTREWQSSYFNNHNCPGDIPIEVLPPYPGDDGLNGNN
jgi:hypothetical protein